jgi:hypothetical protein
VEWRSDFNTGKRIITNLPDERQAFECGSKKKSSFPDHIRKPEGGDAGI